LKSKKQDVTSRSSIEVSCHDFDYL